MAAIEVEKHIDFLLKNANSRGFEWIMSGTWKLQGEKSKKKTCLMINDHNFDASQNIYECPEFTGL